MLPAKALIMAGRLAATLRSGGMLTQADRDEAAGFIEQLAEFVAELPEPESRYPSDTPEARRLRKQRSRGTVVTSVVTTRDSHDLSRVMSRVDTNNDANDVTSDVTSADPIAAHDVRLDVTTDVTSAVHEETCAVSENALQLRGAEAAELPNNSTSTHLDARLASKNVELRSKAISSSSRETSLALVTVPTARSVAEITEGIAAVMASVSAGTDQRLAAEKLLRWKTEVAFAYWAKRHHHEKSLLDPKRERRILARLRENDGNLHELLYAVDGALRDDWIMGRDPKSPRKYDGDETIFRDRNQVERLAGLMPKWVAGEPHPLAVKYQALAGQEDVRRDVVGQEVAHG